MKTTLISIDEPSLGLNPNLVFESGDLIEAWNLATKPAKDLDVQIHLHSSAEAEIVYQTDDIAIIGVESAENPENLSGFDKKELEENDRFLRVGVSRTNINGITSDWMEKTGTNVWSEKEKMLEMIDGMESPEIIGKRLEKAYELFGDRIKYAGPDCGMGLWPSQDTARKLLANTARAINTFNNK